MDRGGAGGGAGAEESVSSQMTAPDLAHWGQDGGCLLCGGLVGVHEERLPGAGPLARNRTETESAAASLPSPGCWVSYFPPLERSCGAGPGRGTPCRPAAEAQWPLGAAVCEACRACRLSS